MCKQTTRSDTHVVRVFNHVEIIPWQDSGQVRRRAELVTVVWEDLTFSVRF